MGILSNGLQNQLMINHKARLNAADDSSELKNCTITNNRKQFTPGNGLVATNREHGSSKDIVSLGLGKDKSISGIMVVNTDNSKEFIKQSFLS
jgi:hypothetical protein